MIELNDTTMSTITNKLNSSTSVFKSKTKNGKISNNNNVSAKVNDYRKVIKINLIFFFKLFLTYIILEYKTINGKAKT